MPVRHGMPVTYEAPQGTCEECRCGDRNVGSAEPARNRANRRLASGPREPAPAEDMQTGGRRTRFAQDYNCATC